MESDLKVRLLAVRKCIGDKNNHASLGINPFSPRNSHRGKSTEFYVFVV